MTRRVSNQQSGSLPTIQLPAEKGVTEQLIRHAIQRQVATSEPPADAWQKLQYSILANQPLPAPPAKRSFSNRYTQMQVSHSQLFFPVPRLTQSMLAVLLLLLVAAPSMAPFLVSGGGRSATSVVQTLASPATAQPAQSVQPRLNPQPPKAATERNTPQKASTEQDRVEYDFMAAASRTVIRNLNLNESDANLERDFIRIIPISPYIR